MTDVVQVVTRIGDTVVDLQLVDRPLALAWAAARVDGFVAHVGGEAHAITAAPLRAQLGIAEVTFTRVPRALPSVPGAITDHRLLGYLLGSLVLHLCLWTVANAHGAGREPGIGAPYVGRSHRVLANQIAIDDSELAADPSGSPPRISMRLPDAGDGDDDDDDVSIGYESVDLTSRWDGGALAEVSAADLGAKAAEALGGSTDLAAAVGASEAGHDVDDGRGFGRVRAQRTANDLGWGTIGTGRYGRIGHGTVGYASLGTDNDVYGTISGLGGMRSREAAVPQVYLCGRPDGGSHSCVVAVGELDKAMIARYMRRHLAKVRYCYEKQLLTDHALEEVDVLVEFVISPSGKVTAVDANGSSLEVAACVADVVRAIEFPRTQNGGDTQVRYPFSFRLAG